MFFISDQTIFLLVSSPLIFSIAGSNNTSQKVDLWITLGSKLWFVMCSLRVRHENIDYLHIYLSSSYRLLTAVRFVYLTYALCAGDDNQAVIDNVIKTDTAMKCRLCTRHCEWTLSDKSDAKPSLFTTRQSFLLFYDRTQLCKYCTAHCRQ